MVITSALLAKYLLVTAAVSGAASLAYIAIKEYEKSKNWNNIMDKNIAFKTVYSNDKFRDNFSDSNMKDKIANLKEMVKADIISDEEFKQLSTEIVKSK